MLPEHLQLFKLVWHPDNLSDDGKSVLPTAFRKEELSGQPDDFVSADRQDLASRAVMEKLAAAQQKQADGIKIHRLDPYIAVLNCGEVGLVTAADELALRVIEDPLPDNIAHCGIQSRNLQQGKYRSFLAEVRQKLVLIAGSPLTFDEAYNKEVGCEISQN